jgi:hypothetical protein
VAQPTQTISRRALEAAQVTFRGVTYRARVHGSSVEVNGDAVPFATAAGSAVEVVLGAKVPSLLSKEVAPSEHEDVLAAAVIVAAIAGHPRRDPRGQAIRFVWTDHVALGAQRSAATALRHSYVKDAQADHFVELAQNIHIEDPDHERRSNP